jgi:hypothetical protein
VLYRKRPIYEAVGLEKNDFVEICNMTGEALIQKTIELCKPGLVAEEAVMDAERVLAEVTRRRNTAWFPLARFILLRRYIDPLGHATLVDTVKAELRKLIKSQLAKERPSESEPPRQIIDDMLTQRWTVAMNAMKSEFHWKTRTRLRSFDDANIAADLCRSRTARRLESIRNNTC